LSEDIGREFGSYAFFYERDQRRRSDDIELDRIADGEYRWQICWLLGTGEVVAFCIGWAVEDSHWSLIGTNGDYGGRAGRLEQPPQFVRVVGCSATASEAAKLTASRGEDSVDAIAEAFVR
jgi:hypothetical protein